MKNLPYVLMALAALALANCTPLQLYSAGTTAAIYASRPDDPPPADTEDQIAEHESWCYGTMGYPECYTKPQNTNPQRLINVDPKNKYPLTNHNYWDLVYSDK
jgi:hypothetical protein